jgi:hypothetical protein
MESSVLEKIKAGPAFAVANFALTKAGNVSSRPNCMMTRQCMMCVGSNQAEVQMSREIEKSMSSSRSETDCVKTSQDNSSSISHHTTIETSSASMSKNMNSFGM